MCPHGGISLACYETCIYLNVCNSVIKIDFHEHLKVRIVQGEDCNCERFLYS